MELHEENEVLNWIDTFSVPVIPRTKRFWMIRTKKGYFYNEFISKRFVALAWNNITQNTDFSESSRDSLKDDILMEFNEIQRPSTVINKCISFINEIHTDDILV